MGNLRIESHVPGFLTHSLSLCHHRVLFQNSLDRVGAIPLLSQRHRHSYALSALKRGETPPIQQTGQRTLFISRRPRIIIAR